MTENAITVISKAEQIEKMKQAYIPLLREMIVGGRKLTDDQIIGRAVFAAEQGLDPISEVHTLTDRDGKTMGHTMAVNGLRRKNQEAVGQGENIDLEFVTLPKDNMQQDWAYAFECRLRDSVSYRNWQKRILEVGKTLKEVLGQVSYQDIINTCGPAPVVAGVGIVYRSEITGSIKDMSFNPIERAKKRAEVNARHHRFSTSAPVYDSDNGSVFDVVATEGTLSIPSLANLPEPVHHTVNDNLAALGFAPEPEKVPAPTPAPEQHEDDAGDYGTDPTPPPVTASLEAWQMDSNNVPYDTMGTPELRGHERSIAARHDAADKQRLVYIAQVLAQRSKATPAT